jgi:transposase-like protein
MRNRGAMPGCPFYLTPAQGLCCPACGDCKHSVVEPRALYRCSACRTQTSLTAGTICHYTKLPLKTWFRTIFHMTQTKGGISSLEPARRLGVSQNTAWKISHNLMQVMHEREGKRPLKGRIEMDDASLGGKRKGKRGRGASGKLLLSLRSRPRTMGNPPRVGFYRSRS